MRLVLAIGGAITGVVNMIADASWPVVASAGVTGLLALAGVAFAVMRVVNRPIVKQLVPA